MSGLRKEIECIEAGHFYTGAEAEAVMEELLSGRVETPEILRLLTALNPACAGAGACGICAGDAAKRHASLR
jgi:hypothetical protein